MEVQDNGVQFGWEGDEGWGDLLLERLLAGSLTVLFEPVALLDVAEAEALRSSLGEVVTVFDADGEPRCNVRVVGVFETTWGDPDPRLVAGDGYGPDVDGWRRANHTGLEQALDETGERLTATTGLLVQQVEVVDEA